MPRCGLILAVEDEARNAALLRAILEGAGHNLHVAPTLSAARAWLAVEQPDLVLVDRHLPDGDGLDLVAELRASPRYLDRPILMISASVLQRDREAALAGGCDQFLEKPVRVRALLQAVAQHLS